MQNSAAQPPESAYLVRNSGDPLPAVHGWLPTLRIADFEVVEWIYGRGARPRMEQLLAERLFSRAER